jgi:hypothetical protein
VASALVAVCLRRWGHLVECLRRGKGARAVVADVEAVLGAGQSCKKLLQVALQNARKFQQEQPGVRLREVEKAQKMEMDLLALEGQAGELLELLRRPHKPADREQVRQAREAFEQGNYRDVEDVLRERGWVSPD